MAVGMNNAQRVSTYPATDQNIVGDQTAAKEHCEDNHQHDGAAYHQSLRESA